MSARCDWDPEHDRAALDYRIRDKVFHSGCQNVATLSVGSAAGPWHLCDSCATLPQFKRYRIRRPLRRVGE